MRKLITRSDIMVIAAVLAFALMAWSVLAWYNQALDLQSLGSAVIYKDGSVYRIIDLKLSDDAVVGLPDIDVELEIKEHKISFKSSDCHDKICVSQGFISKSGQIAVCVPNKVAVVIVGASSGVDAVAG